MPLRKNEPQVKDDWKCLECDGAGKVGFDCETCEGHGWVDDEENGGTMTCPDCEDERCETCKGTGERPADKVT